MLKSKLSKQDKKLLETLLSNNRKLLAEIDSAKLLTGKLFAQQVKKSAPVNHLQEVEFRVFSQWGDDGIIQYLVNRLDIPVTKFVEFGVENYREANTRFLLQNNNWSGLVMDCSDDNVTYIKNDEIYWKYDLTAIASFVTTENINQLLSDAGFSGGIGLLHIDIDGNDYWIWEAIDVIQPVTAIIEYNSLFGSERSITIPYEPNFSRFDAHHSGLYAGASLSALCELAERKGYTFIGSNSAGNNAYFVRRDCLGELRELSVAEGYVPSKFREHRNEQGQLTYLTGQEAIEQLRGLPVFNTQTKSIEEF